MLKKLLSIAFILSVASAIAQPPIGLQMGTFGKQLRADLPGTLSKMKELGITEVEGGGSANMTSEEYKKLLQDHNIKVVAIGSNFDSLQRNPAKYAKLAKALGAEQVICYWVPHT